MLCRVTHSADRAFVFATLAMVPERDFNALRGLPWRIPSSAAADSNEGGVVAK